MASITTLTGSDGVTTANSMTKINTNFSNLNNDKIETSYLDTDTSLTANSDTKIATQKAVKAYVDSGGNPNASETQKGVVEEATDAEVTAGTATGATGAKLFVTPAKLATYLGSAGTTMVENIYTTTSTQYGEYLTRYDITNTTGSTYRYTYDSTGTNPNITDSNPAVGAVLTIQAQNFAAGNKGVFTVTASGTNYFEVTNPSGVVESDKTVGTGYISKISTTWTKPTALKYVEVECLGGGGGAGGASSTTWGGGGGGGAYSYKKILAASLGATENVWVGSGGGIDASTHGFNGKPSLFGSHLLALGGTQGLKNSTGGAGGVASSGNLNINGGAGWDGASFTQPKGGNSVLGFGGKIHTAGSSYGGGGGGTDAGTGSPGVGAQGIVIVREYYL